MPGMSLQRPTTQTWWLVLRTHTRTCSSSTHCKLQLSQSGLQTLIIVARALTPSSSRPQTPNSASRNSGRSTQTPPLGRVNSALSSTPTRPPYTSYTNSVLSVEDDEEDEDEAHEYVYSENADEDEFGLPSIANMRREARRRQNPKTNDPGGGRVKGSIGLSGFGTGSPPRRVRANSSDIAEERGPPSYPTAKKSEGKILRPQYKDILRGLYILLRLTTSAEVLLRQIPQTPFTLSAILLCR